MAGLVVSVAEATGLTDLYPVAPRDVPAEHEAPRRLSPRKGDRFTPHNTDSVGRVVSDPRRNRRSVQFRYEHDRGTLHSMDAHEFTSRFCRLLGRATQRASGVRHIRPGVVPAALRKAA